MREELEDRLVAEHGRRAAVTVVDVVGDVAAVLVCRTRGDVRR